MSGWSKTAECPLPEHVRKRLEVTIDPENPECPMKCAINVS